MRACGLFVALGVVVGIGLVSRLPATSGQSTPDADHRASMVTWSKEIAPVFQQHCQGCHRPGDIAPFPLLSYVDAYRERQKILRVVERRKMPPWKPVPGFGEFLDARRLSEAEIASIRDWVAAGAPEGEAKELPLARQWPETWTLGAPDVVLAPESSFEVSSSDRDLYRCFVIPTHFAEDRYLSAVEFAPGNRKIVHHVLASTPPEPRWCSTRQTRAWATPASAAPGSRPPAASAGGRPAPAPR